DAEVSETCLAADEQNVRGLHIAVNESFRMCRLQCAGDGPRDEDRLFEGKLPLLRESVTEAPAIHDRHYAVQHSFRLTRVEQRNDVRMVQRRREADFPEKSRTDQRLDELRLERLDGDHPSLRGIAREVHDRRSTTTQLPLDLVPAGERLPNHQARTFVHAALWGKEIRRFHAALCAARGATSARLPRGI